MHTTTIPDRGTYQNVQPCPHCGTAFQLMEDRGRIKRYRARCTCQIIPFPVCVDPERTDGRYMHYQEIDETKIGTPIPTHCQECLGRMYAGEPAIEGIVQPYSRTGYWHPACAQLIAEREAVRAAFSERAAKGVKIVVWFGPSDDPMPWRFVLGASADRKQRMLPANLPLFNEAQVLVLEQVRQPIAKTILTFIDWDEAEAFWQAATSVTNAYYELYWFESADQEAQREWTGDRFRTVEVRAQHRMYQDGYR